MYYLTSALDRGEWSASRPGSFNLRERAPWYPLYRTLDGPQSWSGHGVEEKNSHPRRDSNPNRPIVQPVVSRYTC
jgi:hypothetical protein